MLVINISRVYMFYNFLYEKPSPNAMHLELITEGLQRKSAASGSFAFLHYPGVIFSMHCVTDRFKIYCMYF